MPLKILALGSSYAAGASLQPIIDTAAGRSAVNYAHLVAEQLDAELVDVTSSGSTLLNILSDSFQPPWAGPEVCFPPQLESLTSDVDVVLITSGGNDIGYISGLLCDAAAHTLWPLPVAGILNGRIPAAMEDLEAAEELITERFTAIIDAIRAKAPRAHIYLIEYLVLIGNDNKAGRHIGLSEQQVVKYRNTCRAINNAYRAAAARANKSTDYPRVTDVPMGELSLAHALGSEDPWTAGFSIWSMVTKRPWLHPNYEGHRAVSRELVPLLKQLR